jgi:hypothetical protein
MEFLYQIGVHLKTDAPLFNERGDLLGRGPCEQQQGDVIRAQGLIGCRGQEGK